MSQYDAAERIALAIHHHGWGSLSDSEAEVMNSNDEFSAMVHTLLQKYRRARMLLSDDKAVKVTEPFKGLVPHALVQWEYGDDAREAQLWGSAANDRLVLEIKEWPIESFHNAASMGAHQLIYQQTIAGDNEVVIRGCQSILVEYRCPEDKRSEFTAAARSSLNSRRRR